MGVHDLGMRLAFQPSRTRLTRAALTRAQGRMLCDIPSVRAVVADPVTIEVDGFTVLRMWSLCAFRADELVLVELTWSDPTSRIILSARIKSRCIRVWTR